MKVEAIHFFTSFSRPKDSDLLSLRIVFFGEIQMGKPAVSRDAFRGLFAFYAARAHHDHDSKGDPNGGTDLSWPKYDPAADVALVLDDTLSTQSKIAGDRCDFWDSIATQ